MTIRTNQSKSQAAHLDTDNAGPPTAPDFGELSRAVRSGLAGVKTLSQGSVLLVTLCTAWVVGIVLVSFLALVANQNRTTYHSHTWNTCIPVLEAGIEEALTQLNF